jgi:hypothetical protein
MGSHGGRRRVGGAVSVLRRLAGNLGLILAGVVFALVIAEVGLRIVNRHFPYFFCYDAQRGWALKPGVSGHYNREGESWVYINRDGFRGPERPLEKAPGVYRVVVLGDSYAEAVEVPYEKTFSAVIERHLAECPALKGKRIEVLDMGVSGYGTAQELLTMREKAWAYAPDAVVLAIFLGNDIRNNSVVLEGDQCRPFYVLRSGKLVPAGPFFGSDAFRFWCMARFDYRDASIPGLLANAWSIVTHRNRVPTPEYPIERAINYNIYKPPADAAWRDAWAVTDALVTETAREVRAHQALFLAVTLDTGIQVWPDPKVRERFMRRQGISDIYYPDEQMQALGKREGFAVLTLAPALAAYAQSHHVYLHGFSNTPMGFGHWNSEGHRLAGEMISERLCQMIETEGGKQR